MLVKKTMHSVKKMQLAFTESNRKKKLEKEELRRSWSVHNYYCYHFVVVILFPLPSTLLPGQHTEICGRRGKK